MTADATTDPKPHDTDGDWRAMFTEIADSFENAPSPAQITLPEVTRNALAGVNAIAVIHAWVARVIRTGEAAILLDSNGLGTEASPLIRSVVEHAMALHWVSDMPAEAFQALVRARQQELDKLKQAQATGFALNDAAVEQIEAMLKVETDKPTEGIDHLLLTKQRAEQYGLGHLYQAWLVETATSHPGLASAVAYYTYDPATEQFVLLRRAKSSWQKNSMTAVLGAFIAIVILNKHLPGEPLGDQISDWQTRMDRLGARMRYARQGGG